MGVATVDESTNGVRVERIDGQWAVQIFENGETTQHLFENEEFARNFAAGQLIRLNSPPIQPKRRQELPSDS
ncbi:hypothetical protein X726_05045 [Mesorhizobium sp. L103C105A0]|nr:hypothetical protein X726_05045 [Mesorhizobium sp. L103C105A0]